MRSIILFCQAPADVQFALTIYNRYVSDSRISIFCINVEGMYNFLNKLELNLESLVFIPYDDFNISYKKPLQSYSTKRKLKALFGKYFKQINNYKIYYFSHYFDFVTFYLLSKLSLANTVYFINHYDEAISQNYSKPKESLELKILRTLFRFITGVKFKFLQFNSSFILEFPYDKFGIEEIKNGILDKNIYNKYSYKIVNGSHKSILFLEADFNKEDFYNNYVEATKIIVDIIKKLDYKIYLKPHPRIGYSLFLKQYIYKIVNPDIPAEFIDEGQFDFVIGISSSSLAFIANRNKTRVLSLINLYEFKNDGMKRRYLGYIFDLSQNIKLIESLDDFQKMIIPPKSGQQV